jgi:hypothetical protein
MAATVVYLHVLLAMLKPMESSVKQLTHTKVTKVHATTQLDHIRSIAMPTFLKRLTLYLAHSKLAQCLFVSMLATGNSIVETMEYHSPTVATLLITVFWPLDIQPPHGKSRTLGALIGEIQVTLRLQEATLALSCPL